MTGLSTTWNAKTNCSTKDGPNNDFLHMATDLDHQTRETLAVVPAAWLAKETQTLLDTISAATIPFKDNMITANALLGMPIVVETITNHGIDYFLAIKAKQPIVQDCHIVFDTFDEDDSHQTARSETTINPSQLHRTSSTKLG